MPPNRNLSINNRQIRNSRPQIISRIRIVYSILIFIGAIFIIRLFYLQIIKHSYYQQAAYSDQLKAYEIPSQRGMIEANSAGQVVPLVLNQTLYTLFADPTLIKDSNNDSIKIKSIIGGDSSNFKQQITTPNTQYVVLAKKITKEQSDAILALKLPGIETIANNYRTYPDGSLASTLLGFVNDNNQGQYGIEQSLNTTLAGKNGQVKAVTDAQGIPLVGNKNNILNNAVNGSNVVLTINIPIQQQLETILQAGLKRAKSQSGSVTIIDPNSGNIVAMADNPSYDPSNYSKVSSPSEYQNSAVDNPIEVGSIMKTLTVAAAFDTGAVKSPDQIFNDPGSYNIDGSQITDIAQDSGLDKGPISVTSILVNSLNTGATWLLSQMGGGQINSSARSTWYDYMINHYRLGSPTGIQQGYEASGFIPDPNVGAARNLAYANTSFGQAMTATPLQMAAAVSAVLNGGTYYQPNLIQGVINPSTGSLSNYHPKIWKKNIVSLDSSSKVEQIMESVVKSNYYFYSMTKPRAGYVIGGKTGTAQIANPSGGYYTNKFNGTFVGFVGTNSPQYVIMVEVDDPNLSENSVNTYAGAGAAAPIFGMVTDMLINGGYIN